MVKRYTCREVNEECAACVWIAESDYDAAIDALRLLFKEMELSGNLGSKDYGWPKAITASRAILDGQSERDSNG